MLAKVLSKGRDAGGGCRSLIRYVMRSAEEGAPEVEAFTNCLSLETAHLEMRAVAHRNVRVHGPIFHFIVAWREGEHPHSAQLCEAGRAALEALGMPLGDHQYVFAVHRDTGGVHLHVVVNRVNLQTGHAALPGLSYLKLGRCMRELELRQGWEHDRGPFMVVERDGQPVVERDLPSPGSARHSLPARARAMETFSGIESLATYIGGAPLRDVLAALSHSGVTWQDVHEALAQHALELRIRGHGLAIHAKGHETRLPVKASSVDECLGRGRLEARLGPWEPPARMIQVSQAARHYGEREINDASASHREAYAESCAALRAKYAGERRRQEDAFAARRQAMRSRHETQYRELLERHRLVRERIFGEELTSIERRAVRSIAAFERARELERLREQQRAERGELARVQSYRQWVEMLAQQGDESALVQLYGWARRRTPRRVVQPARSNWISAVHSPDAYPLPPGRAHVMENWTWRVDTANGNVHYLRQGEQQLTDEGWRVVFDSNDARQDAMLTGLLLARQKFGPHIDVTGSEDFRQRSAMLVVKYRLDIRFGDTALEAVRLALIREREQEAVARARQKPSDRVAQRERMEDQSVHRVHEREPQATPLRAPIDGPER
ncbi:relaxase/mobilization nuclease-like protein [Paraburkholderia silvatlantica]|uniref:Relaxase/mobilization nuclease-like protein n=1 Tax=Paraburkholderia silvatlantica TaxID=321895 RepID=A0A2V4TDT0_9BURK|nr:TraI/MobA(P) family conjugative relaxase [Paraburkholderia silvatlantica]PYE16569.1 relaxase/mobilization nuclease-like protein [Paraburkholderia silvatlantica]